MGRGRGGEKQRGAGNAHSIHANQHLWGLLRFPRPTLGPGWAATPPPHEQVPRDVLSDGWAEAARASRVRLWEGTGLTSAGVDRSHHLNGQCPLATLKPPSPRSVSPGAVLDRSLPVGTGRRTGAGPPLGPGASWRVLGGLCAMTA